MWELDENWGTEGRRQMKACIITCWVFSAAAHQNLISISDKFDLGNVIKVIFKVIFLCAKSLENVKLLIKENLLKKFCDNFKL